MNLEGWEWDLINRVSAAFRTDREELGAELALKVLVFKSKSQSGIRNWKGYLAKLLYNKAANLVRDCRARERIERARSDEWMAPSRYSLHGPAFIAIWNELKPRDREICQVLIETNGNRSHAARRLSTHRNTISRRLREIKQILLRFEV